MSARLSLGDLRLSPTLASRSILALEFIRRYWVDYGRSPSHREIAAALSTTVQRVSIILKELRAAGDILGEPGEARGVRLPDRYAEISTSEAILLLQRRGWTVTGGNDEATQQTPQHHEHLGRF